MNTFANFVQKVQKLEDSTKLDAALSLLPLDQLFTEAEAMAEEDPQTPAEDRLVKALLKWFNTWFNWVNAAPCVHCGYEKTEGPKTTQPNETDILYEADVVELWHCPACSGDTRFPRYNDPLKLLKTRTGRCGEWCTVMHLMLRALGRDTRFVWNSEDHVWNEIWSAQLGRWVALDSCEASFDNPLLYADGWGKKMAYVIGFSTGGVRDITPRYVRKIEAALPRSLMSENQLALILAQFTAELRENMDPVDIVEWHERDETETVELREFMNITTVKMPSMPRQSGSLEWTVSRGEAGSQ